MRVPPFFRSLRRHPFLKNPIPIAAAIALLLSTSHAEEEDWDDLEGRGADLVLGANDFTSFGGPPVSGTLSQPRDIAVDPATGKVYVCDTLFDRILIFASSVSLQNGDTAIGVLGQPDTSTTTTVVPPTASNLDGPESIFLDSNGHLWVSDSDHHRILRYNNVDSKASGAAADAVLGQTGFTSGTNGTTASQFWNPDGIVVDTSGNLWVADTVNSRVLRFDNAIAKANGAPADAVLGQADFVSMGRSVTATGMGFPSRVEIAPTGNTLWVADLYHNRVLRFDNVQSKENGAAADGVLGQLDFTSDSSGLSATKFSSPYDVSLDHTGALWVSDEQNDRILRFIAPASKADGGAADSVLGQLDFTSNVSARTASNFDFPAGIFFEGDDTVWVACAAQSRVLRFGMSGFIPAYRSDAWAGPKPGRQKGNNIYNTVGAGQTTRIKMKGNRAGKGFFTIQNDGNSPDTFTVRATKGNRKLKIKYLQRPGGNVTGNILRGRLKLTDLAPGARQLFKTRIKATPRSRGKRAGKKLTVSASSANGGGTDVVRAKVKKTP